MAISEPGIKQESTSTFVDLEHVGPGTPAGNWMRQFWHPVFRAEDLEPGRARGSACGHKGFLPERAGMTRRLDRIDGAQSIRRAELRLRATPAWLVRDKPRRAASCATF